MDSKIRDLESSTLDWEMTAQDGRTVVVSFNVYPLVPETYAAELVSAIKSISGNWTFGTKLSNKRVFFDLFTFLEKVDWSNPARLLVDYQSWGIEHRSLRRALHGARLACRLVEWLADDKKSIWYRVEIPRIERQSRPVTVREKPFLSRENVRKIVDVCRQKVDEMTTRYEVASRLVYSSEEPRNLDEQILKKNLVSLMNAGDGYLPTRIQARSNSEARKTIKSGFGIRDLKTHLFPTFKEIVPFYILMLYETAGNPVSILWMENDCILKNPVDSNQVTVHWKKNRASHVQRKWFELGKPYEPPALVNKLELVTTRTRDISGGFSKYLFVVVSNTRKKIKVPDYSNVHLVIADFIAENNLQDFNPEDFRRFAANRILTKYKDPMRVKDALNHKSIRTTRRYVDRNQVAQEVASIISAGQAKIVSVLDYGNSIVSKESNKNFLSPVLTVFGFQCTDPNSGVAPGSRKGVPCGQFGKCGSCENAVILIDSAEHVARILQARDCLRKAERAALVDSEKMLRFKAFYERTLNIIDEVLIPQVPEPTLARAISILPGLPSMLELDV